MFYKNSVTSLAEFIGVSIWLQLPLRRPLGNWPIGNVAVSRARTFFFFKTHGLGLALALEAGTDVMLSIN